jgi:ComF family protein
MKNSNIRIGMLLIFIYTNFQPSCCRTQPSEIRDFSNAVIKVKKMIRDLINLVMPLLCPTCGRVLVNHEKIICTACQYELPRTRYASYTVNPVARLFWGRVYIENATAFFQFEKGSRFQQLIHELKYRDRQDIGKEMGRLLGTELKETAFASADVILPVPLHKTKRRQRGYNQCDPIAEGLSERLGIPWQPDYLIRQSASRTQTNRSRTDRWSNVDQIFAVKNEASLSGKHIILVDDVVTTGATLDACASAILSRKNVRVSIATLAVALKVFN